MEQGRTATAFAAGRILQAFPPGASRLWLIASLVIGVGAFVTDLMTPLGFAHGTIYVFAVGAAAMTASIPLVVGVTLVALLMTAVGFLGSPTDFDISYAILNRVVSALALVAFGVLCALAIRLAHRTAGESEAARSLTGMFGDLASAHDMFRLAGRMARIGTWQADLVRGTLAWSPETAEIHDERPGFQPTVEQALAYYAPGYREAISEAFAACSRQGTSFDLVAEIITARDRRVWVRALGEAVRNDRGRIIAVRGAFQDISELIETRRKTVEAADRLRGTLDAISDAFLLLDQDWKVEYMNRQAGELLRRSPEELHGQVVWDEFPEAVGSTFDHQYRHAVTTGETVSFIEYFPPLESWFDVTAYPGEDGLAIYFRNVTRQRDEARQLRLLENAVSRINDMVVITEASPLDEPGPRILYVNDAFVRRTGYTAAEAIGQSPRILQGADTCAEERARIRAALERGEGVRSELVNYTRSGEPYRIELDIVPVAARDGAGPCFVAVQRDVTERHLAQEAVRQSAERFRLIVQATNDVIWDWDVRARRIWRSGGLMRFFGRDPDRIGDSLDSWLEAVHDDDRSRVEASFHAVVDGGGNEWREEYRYRRSDGSWAIVRDRGFVIRDADGHAVRVIGSVADVTEQRQLEERLRQSQKLEALGQLTGGIAHDFNNLLTIMLGNAELLAEYLADRPDQRSLAEMTRAAAERGAQLTGRLLAFARRQPLEPRRVDLNRLLAEMDALLRRTIGGQIEVEFVRAGGLWGALVDAGQLEVALLNLAINARDAMDGGGRLTIETANAYLDQNYADTHDEVEPGQYVMMSVSDNGSGMPAEVVERAFEPFFTTKEIGKGSGLGLSMVYGFVKQSGGHIKIYSEPGVGTSVKIYLPRADERVSLDGPDIVREGAPEGREVILVVEDDLLVRNHVVTQLEGLGYRVLEAGSGVDALAILDRRTRDPAGPVDLLFTDVVMPGELNGRQLADRAIALHPRLRVLFTSGYTENTIVHHGRLDPGVEFLAKPYRRSDLARKVRAVLDAPLASGGISGTS